MPSPALILRASKFFLVLLTQTIQEKLKQWLSLSLSHSFHVIPQGQRIAQLLLLPYHIPNNSNCYPVTRGEQGFRSTGDQGVSFTQQILSDWPTYKVKIQGKIFSGLLNTGADVSIITSHQWPDDRPLTETQGKISGLGEPQQCTQIAAILPCLGPDKQLTDFFFFFHLFILGRG